MISDKIHVFGIRHHGAGSARSLERALKELDPDAIVVEGPPDADSILGLAAESGMEPPVAILVTAPSAPGQASFYPFAAFSPEWRAIQFALHRGIPVRFMDLPQQFQLKPAEASAESAKVRTQDAEGAGDQDLRGDPLRQLAKIAGFEETEAWWDASIEGRGEDEDSIFEALHEAITALREGDEPGVPGANASLQERRREAFMRKTLRATVKEGFGRIAVVCGAWHTPALRAQKLPTIKHDNSLLKGLRKVKTEATWTPWTYDRLTTSSGYGAGIDSPAWYELLFTGAPDLSARWMVSVAQLLREEDVDASSAHVIEAVRLAQMLAALRGRTLPGLVEHQEAVRSILCAGNAAPMSLIHRRLVIGDRIGSVPESAPAAPLQRDLAALQKRLRLRPTAGSKALALDLRKPLHLERSQLLHRLRLLGVPWGEPGRSDRRSKGSFAEHWELRWEPELAVKLIEVSRFGNTVADAARAFAVQKVGETNDLPGLAELLSAVLMANLPGAVGSVAKALETRAASGNDVQALMVTFSPLVRVARYGSVRVGERGLVDEILSSVFVRIAIGLPDACRSLSENAAAAMLERIMRMEADLSTLQDEGKVASWQEALAEICARNDSAPVLSGRATRILHEARQLEPGEAALRMQRFLSDGAGTLESAAWIEGFLRGSGLVLIHDRELWAALDQWLMKLAPDRFIEALPLLRRTFSTFEPPERRRMGEQVGRGSERALNNQVNTTSTIDAARAAHVLPLMHLILKGEPYAN